MSISPRLSSYLEQHGTRYELFVHEHSDSSAETARRAHIPPGQLAKSVVLEDEAGYLVAVVPADKAVVVGQLAHMLGRKHLHLCDEDRISRLFADCERGAVPPIGMAWGIDTIVDDDLDASEVVYMEAGDHECLLRMPGQQFRELMGASQHGHFCKTVARG